jgi:hypothetical protein
MRARRLLSRILRLGTLAGFSLPATSPVSSRAPQDRHECAATLNVAALPHLPPGAGAREDRMRKVSFGPLIGWLSPFSSEADAGNLNLFRSAKPGDKFAASHQRSPTAGSTAYRGRGSMGRRSAAGRCKLDWVVTDTEHDRTRE